MKFAAIVLFIAVAGVTLAPGFAQPSSAAKKAPPKKTTPAKTSRKTVASKKGVRTPGVVRQSVPSPDRYKEIQQALASKGYLKTEPNGVWDANSVDAMKRFQSDQKQDPNGKLTAAALIGLGLGPKHEMPTAPVQEPPKPDTTPTPQP